MEKLTLTADRKSLCELMENAMRQYMKSSDEASQAAKEASARSFKDHTRALDLFRSIKSISPDYQFEGPTPTGPEVKSKDAHDVKDMATITDGYGKWTGLADRILLAKRSGRFAELRDYGVAQGWIDSEDEKAEAGLRQALHGMKSRGVISYTPGPKGRGGVFKLKD